jgi:cell division protein FtsZ
VSTAVKGVAEIITVHGNVNIDYADVKTVMQKSDVFIMGTGYAVGEGRAMEAVNVALESPLLDSNDIYGTKNILLNIISGKQEVRIGEIGEIIETLQKRAGQEADIIWGNGYDESLGDKISVTILATGFVTNPNKIFQPRKELERIDLEDQMADFDPSESVFNDMMDFPVDEHEPVLEVTEMREKVHEQEKPQKERISVFNTSKREERKKVKTPEPVSENDDNWFFKKFGLGRLFDNDDDQSM